MPAKLNLENKIFGRLTVISPENTGKRTAWLCQCSCGKSKVVLTQLLVSGKTSSCGCFRKECLAKKNAKRAYSLIGSTFGKLTVVEKTGAAESGIVWGCVCECGNRIEVTTGRLTTGNNRSCGCYKSETLKEKHKKENDISHQHFGYLSVTSSSEVFNGQRYWLCLCDCGQYTKATTGQLNAGHRTSCGCQTIIRTVDLVGQKFSRLTVVERLPKLPKSENRYKCICDCGKNHIVSATMLLQGKTKSCGCWKSEQTSKTFRKHGKAGTKEYSAIVSARRRATARNAEGRFTVNDIEELFIKQEGLCVYCQVDLRDLGFHRDHMIPLVRGGSNEIRNIQLLCPKCNMKKHKQTHDEFLNNAAVNRNVEP